MFFRFRSVMASVCAIALILAFSPTIDIAVAQEVVIGELSGVSVSIGGDWSHDAAASSSSDDIDSLVFSNGNTQFVVSGGTSDIGSSLEHLGIIHTVIDIDVAATYALRGVDADGRLFGVFQVAVGNHVQTVIAPVSGFANAVSSAQADIQIDGASVLSGVDGVGLAAAIASSVGSGDASSDASVPALLEAGDDADIADDADAETATEETASDETQVDDAAEATSTDETESVASGETGFVDSNTFVSPQFGTTVTWDDAWRPWLDADGEPRFTSVESEFGAYDSLCLESSEEGSFWTVCYDFEAPNEFTADYFESYSDTVVNPSSGLPYFGVIVTDSAVAYSSTDLEGNARVIQEEITNDVWVESRMHWDLETLPDVVEAAQTGIQIDGEPSFSLLDSSIFRSETEGMIASIPTLIAERDANLAAMGLQTPTHYVSVAYGCDIAWSEARYLNLSDMNAIYVYDEWVESLNDSVNVEGFYLSALEPPYTGFTVSCFENLPEIEAWWPWNSNPEALQIEGERVLYLVQPSGESHDIAMIVKPVGEPTLIVRFYASSSDLATIQNGEPGQLVINGIDIIEFLQEDDLVSQLP